MMESGCDSSWETFAEEQLIFPTTFTSKVVNISKMNLDLAAYPRLVPPVGMTPIWEPKILPHADLQIRAGGTSVTSVGSGVNGLTEPAFSVSFESPRTQWAKDQSGMWQFQGGNVVVRLDLLILVTDKYEGESYRNDVVALIMTHELKHWQDNVDIVTTWLPPKLKTHADIKRLLIDDGKGQPARLSQAEYDKWFTQVNPETEGTKWEDAIIDTYIAERDRRDQRRDSSNEYQTYSSNISALRQKRPELVVWPK